MSINLEEAVALLLKTTPLSGETILPLEDSRGMVLAKDIIAGIDQPPFDRSPLDGYALRSADTANASADSPVRLSVAGTLCAGDFSAVAIQSGQAMRIMTGAPVPSGCDCVIKQEETGRERDKVAVYRRLAAHENICFRGEDFKAGSLLLAAGTKLNAAAIGVLSGAGLAEAPALRKPRAALISTGDELVEPGRGKTLPPGKIYSSNLAMLRARLCELGFPPATAIQTGDDPALAAALVKETLAQADVLITTGGVSVGEKDLFNEVFPLLGAEQIFHGVKIKPGTPAMFSLFEGKPILSLSGNPFAAAATFELLGRPLLSALACDVSLLPVKTFAALLSPYGKTAGTYRFVRGRLDNGQVVLPEGHSSGQLRSLVGCNCLVEIPPDTPLSKGCTVGVYLL